MRPDRRLKLEILLKSHGFTITPQRTIPIDWTDLDAKLRQFYAPKRARKQKAAS